MFGKPTFRGGIHPPHNKEHTEKLAIEELPVPEEVVIPLSMHIGAPAKALVKRGDKVKIGTVIAEAGGFVSSPVHASISGDVVTVENRPHPMGRNVLSVVIKNDFKNTMEEFVPLAQDWKEAAQGDIVKKIQEAGIVGMGGASFPTHVKLSPPSEKTIDTLIINAAECEPYLTADHRMLLEKTDEILNGILILKKTIGAKNVYIGIEDNKPDAIEKLNERIKKKPDFSQIKLVVLLTKYPQGGEKQLINAITKRQVPSGGLPMDVGCVVQNVGTTYAIWNAIINGVPLYERVTTVTGPNVKKSGNFIIRVGTPISYVLDHCETDVDSAEKVIMGGPMMGLALSNLSSPVIKSTSGLLVISEKQEPVKAHNCISCGNCVSACPIHLVPSMIAKYVSNGKYAEAEEWNVMDCIECGSCSYVCPSKINLVHFMKFGKFNVISSRKKALKNKG